MREMVARTRGLALAGVVAALLLAHCSGVVAQPAAPVRVLEVRGVINPFVAQYVERSLGQGGSRLYVVLLDTPGGSEAAMRRVVQAILASEVPVVVYVAPAGARAGSAGMFVALAAHIAAMAPGSHIGAAHPVGVGGEELGATLASKVASDAAALARSLAELRGRNAAWAEQAVLASVSITTQEAMAQRVVDLEARDLADLLARLDGREVSTAAGPVVLSLSGAPLERVPMTWLERLLQVLIDPNIAYLLMTIGMLAIIIELFHPGLVIPGTVGAICLLLAFIAFESLPLNWGGLALIILALAFFVLDIKVAGFFLSVGGVVAFVLGSLILFSPFSPASPLMPAVSVNPWLVGTMAVGTAAFFLWALQTALRAQRLPVPVGAHTLVGAGGVAVSALAPVGVVQVQGEQWTAEAEGRAVAEGELVTVVGLKGNKLIVRPQ